MYFSQDDINTVIKDAHAYISKYGLTIIDDYTCLGSSNLEGFFYQYLDLLYAVEERKIYDYSKLDYQRLVQELYSLTDRVIDDIDLSYVFIYGNVIPDDFGQPPYFIKLKDTPSSYSGQGNKFVVVNKDETGLIFSDPKSYYITTTGAQKTINWAVDLVDSDTRTYLQKHGIYPIIIEENKADDGTWTQNASASYIWNTARTTLVLVPQTLNDIFIII